jgi:predicted TPR repeat methyltransferase
MQGRLGHPAFSRYERVVNYRWLAPIFDVAAPVFSRYRSPEILTAAVLKIAPNPCELLDVGIGTGLSVAPYVGLPQFTRIVGLDPSAAMLQRCRQKFPGVELHEGTLQSQSLARFDIIQSCGAVEHISDLAAFFARVADLLIPDGYFVFTFEPEMPSRFWQRRDAPHLGTLGSESVFRRRSDDIHTKLRDAEFEVIEDRPFKAYLGLIHHLVLARR